MLRRIAALLAIGIPLLANCTLVDPLLTGSDGADKSTTIILVRHCERPADTPQNPDPALNEEGLARAEKLKTSLANAGVDVIYCTDLTRNRQSVAPLAQSLGLTPILVNPARYADVVTAGQQLTDEILAAHKGKTILFCGNRGSVLGTPGIIERIFRELDGTGTPPERYADLYTVIVPPEGPNEFILAEYGGKSSLDP